MQRALVVALTVFGTGQAQWPLGPTCADAAEQTPGQDLSSALDMIQTYREGDEATGQGRGSEKLLADANARLGRLAKSLAVARRGDEFTCLKAHRYWVETAYRLDWVANQRQRAEFRNMSAIREYYLRRLVFADRLDDDQRVVFNHYLGNVYIRMFMLERLTSELGRPVYDNGDNFFFCGLWKYAAALEADSSFLPSWVNVAAALKQVWPATKSSPAALNNFAVCRRAVRAHIHNWQSLGFSRQVIEGLFDKADGLEDPDASIVPEPQVRGTVKRTPVQQVALLEVLGAAWLPSDKQAFQACVHNVGVLLLSDGDYAKAKTFFERRVAADPSNLGARRGLTTALASLGGHYNALAEEQLFIIKGQLWLER